MKGTWGMPLLLGALSLGGLAAGILGDGFWDVLSWIGLGIPVVVVTCHIWRQWRAARA